MLRTGLQRQSAETIFLGRIGTTQLRSDGPGVGRPANYGCAAAEGNRDGQRDVDPTDRLAVRAQATPDRPAVPRACLPASRVQFGRRLVVVRDIGTGKEVELA